MGTELVPEMSENHILTWLSARENFIEMYSLYLCNADVNNIVYKVMNSLNQFSERQREWSVSQSVIQSVSRSVGQSVSSPFVSQSDGSVAIDCLGISLRRFDRCHPVVF